ncbi:MAG: N-methyl-L-tryptophan oxidase [Gemmatimonadaceae bacterium]
MKRDYEYIVLGLGGLGSGAAYWLSRRAGAEVLGIEQFELGHVRGESEDHSRIIRLSYHTPAYVELAKLAYDAWATLERDSGDQVVLKTGGLDFAKPDSLIPLDTYRDAMRACNVPFEDLDADEIMRRWPQFTLTPELQGLFQAQSGIAMAARANAAHRKMAIAQGATLLDNTPVIGITTKENEVIVETSGGRFRCRKLVIAAGPWSNKALGFLGMELPLEITREQVTYFASPNAAAFAPDRFPVWIWMDDPCFYGFPVFGEAGPKAAQDAGGKPVTADTRNFDPDPDNLRGVEDFLARYIPGALGPIIYTKTCLYTLTPDRDFVIDHVPGHENVVVAIGAGHAFKFASQIGRLLSELTLDGATKVDLEPFSLERPILKMKNPPKSYMV